MKTVKDYKDAGLVFVEGDKGDTYLIGSPGSFNNNSYFDESIPESFAWRTNTGVKPEFSGLIDIKFKDDGNIYYREISAFYWEGGSVESDVIEWRPHLPSIQTETPEEKAALDKISISEEVPASYKDAAHERLQRITQSVFGEDRAKSPYDVDAHVSDECKSEIYGPTQKPYPKLDVDAMVKAIKKSEDDFKAALMKVGFASSLKRPFESNPVYTQAMCDADKSVAGMRYIDGDGDVCELVGENNSKYVFIGKPVKGGVHPLYLSVSDKSECKPIQTEREITTDKIKALIHNAVDVDSDSNISQASHAIYDLLKC